MKRNALVCIFILSLLSFPPKVQGSEIPTVRAIPIESDDSGTKRLAASVVAMTWDRIAILGLSLGVNLFDQLSVRFAGGAGKYENIDLFIKTRYLNEITFDWRQVYLQYDIDLPLIFGISVMGGVEQRSGQVYFGPSHTAYKQRSSFDNYGELIGTSFFVKTSLRGSYRFKFSLGVMSRFFRNSEFQYVNTEGETTSRPFPEALSQSVFGAIDFLF